MKYSIVVPCYNEEKNIKNLVEHFVPIFQKMEKSGLQVVLVNNGSKDNTQLEINKMMKQYNWIDTVYIEVNQGYGNGILQGLKICKGEYWGWIHADLQIGPENILKIAHELERTDHPENTFFRGRRKNRPLIDTFFTFGMSLFESLYLHERLYDINAQPTLFHKSFYYKFINPPCDFSLDLYVYYLAKKLNMKIKRVVVIQHERIEGTSSWNTGMKSRFKLVKRTFDFSKNLKHNFKGKRNDNYSA